LGREKQKQEEKTKGAGGGEEYAFLVIFKPVL